MQIFGLDLVILKIMILLILPLLLLPTYRRSYQGYRIDSFCMCLPALPLRRQSKQSKNCRTQSKRTVYLSFFSWRDLFTVPLFLFLAGFVFVFSFNYFLKSVSYISFFSFLSLSLSLSLSLLCTHARLLSSAVALMNNEWPNEIKPTTPTFLLSLFLTIAVLNYAQIWKNKINVL